MKFSREPIAYIGLVLVLVQVYQAVVNHQPVDETIINSLLTALGTVIGRKLVTPVAKKENN